MTAVRRLRTLAASGAAILAAATVLASCSSGGESTTSTSQGAEAQQGGTFTDLAQLIADPPHIDPGLVSELDGAQVTKALYQGLTDYDYTDPVNPKLTGSVAESWQSNPDATEFTFKIKQGQKFDNGEPVLPSSVAFAWNRNCKKSFASDYAYLFEIVEGGKACIEEDAPLSGVTADDSAMTLTVKLDKPYADFPVIVSHTIFFPLPEQAMQNLPDQTSWEQGIMIGNGPFKMTAPKNDQQVALERNDNWNANLPGQTKAHLDKLIFKISKDVDSAYKSFQAGEGQSSTIPSGQYAAAKQKYPNNTVGDPLAATYYFDFNVQNDPVVGGEKNVKLRQAISQAIDRDAINQAAYDGVRPISTGITPPLVPGFQENLCQYCKYDKDAAQKAFDDWKGAGNTLAAPLKIQYNSGAGHEEVVKIIISDLNEIGIQAEAEPIESDVYFDKLRDGACVFCRAGWFYDYPLYDNGMYDNFATASIGGNNLGPVSDPEFDSLVEKARSTVDDQEREATFRQAEQRLLNGVIAAVPITWYVGDQVAADGVLNYHQLGTGFIPWDQVGFAPGKAPQS